MSYEISLKAAKPESGKNFNHVRQNYFYARVKSHLIFYRNFNNHKNVEIIRILHQSMDIENRLGE